MPTKQQIESAARELKIPFTISDTIDTPRVTRYQIMPDWYPYASGVQVKRVTVSQITARVSDLEIALGIYGVRVVQNGHLWLEVPKDTASAVNSFRVKKTGLSVGLGIGPDGEKISIDFTDSTTPHLLVAGTTGSGKSVLINAIITGLAASYSPAELGMLLIDPKYVELVQYDELAHLIAPIANDAQETESLLVWTVNEMESRYQKLKDARKRNASELGMKRILVVIDEYADLTAMGRGFERYLVRLAQKGRAAGIHVILATQRPDANVVTGLIKANFPARICFQVVNGTNSRIVLDSGGAERLLGKGDGLFYASGRITRFQGIYINDAQIEAVVADNRRQEPLRAPRHSRVNGKMPTIEYGIVGRAIRFVFLVLWFIIKAIGAILWFVCRIVLVILAGLSYALEFKKLGRALENVANL